MDTYKVSAVSYANTLPFVYGLTHYQGVPPMDLSFDYPALCAEKVIQGKADIGLIPVAVIPSLKYYEILPGYCLGATSKVRTVILVSPSPLEKVLKIILDYQSRTSILLARLLARDFWKISPEWVNGTEAHDDIELKAGEARLLIGDRTFAAEKKYPHVYDLAEAWINWTELPFVFAAWIANRSIDPEFVKKFNASLQYGVQNIPKAASLAKDQPLLEGVNIQQYLTQNLSYQLDNSKLRGMKLFLEMAQTL